MLTAMRGAVRGYFCSDRPDFETWRPERAEDVFLTLDFYIGCAGGEGTDIFSIVIATPQAIRGRPERRKGKLLVVQQYDWQTIKGTLEEWVAACERLTWEEVVDCLRQRFSWEFEGM